MTDATENKVNDILAEGACDTNGRSCDDEAEMAKTESVQNGKEADVEKSLDGSEVKDAEKHKPPDGGWGWMVVVACLLGHVLIVGLARGFGIFYVALKEKFLISDSAASWVPSLFNSLRMVFGPLIAWLCDRYTSRVVVVIGGFIFGAGCVASAYATDIVFLSVSFGVVAAIGAGCVFTPMFIVLNQYFDRNKGKAMSFATFGSGVGTIIMAALVTFLLAEYDYSGAMLIVAGLSFNCIVVGALFRPLPKPQIEIASEQKLSESKGSSLQISENTETSRTSTCKKIFVALKKRLSLIGNTTFLLYGCIIMAMPYCVNLPLVYIPPLCKEYALPDHRTKAALLVSCMSFSDMAGRFFFGFIFDLPKVRPWRRPFHSCLGILMGICVCLVPFMPGIWGMAGMCIVWGFIESGYHSQRATILSTFLRKDEVANSVGFMIFFQGIGNLTCTSIAGVLVDATGTYTYTFVLGGCVMIFFASLFLIEYITVRSLARSRESKRHLPQA